MRITRFPRGTVFAADIVSDFLIGFKSKYKKANTFFAALKNDIRNALKQMVKKGNNFWLNRPLSCDIMLKKLKHHT